MFLLHVHECPFDAHTSDGTRAAAARSERIKSILTLATKARVRVSRPNAIMSQSNSVVGRASTVTAATDHDLFRVVLNTDKGNHDKITARPTLQVPGPQPTAEEAPPLQPVDFAVLEAQPTDTMPGMTRAPSLVSSLSSVHAMGASVPAAAAAALQPLQRSGSNVSQVPSIAVPPFSPPRATPPPPEPLARARSTSARPPPGLAPLASPHVPAPVHGVHVHEADTAAPRAASPPQHVQQTLDPDTTELEKQATLMELVRLQQTKQVTLSRQFTMNDSLADMQFELRRHMLLEEEQEAVGTMKDSMCLAFTGIEYASQRLNLLDLDGWSGSVTSDMTRYDNALRRLYKKYFRRSSGSPEMELAFAIVTSMGIHHMKRKFLTKVQPQGAKAARQRVQPKVFTSAQAAPARNPFDLPPQHEFRAGTSVPSASVDSDDDDDDEQPPPQVTVKKGSPVVTSLPVHRAGGPPPMPGM